MIRIDIRQLGNPSRQLGEGGMAQVFRVDVKVPEFPGKELVFKKLKATVVDPVRTEMLNTMRLSVAIRDAMSPAEQKELDEVTAWPLAMVHEKGTDIGLLMQCLGDEFFIDALPKKRVFEFQLLSADPDQAKALGIETSRAPADKDLVRLSLMANLAYVIEIIHRPRGGVRLVYGDLNLRNAAVAAVANKPPRIQLMDCDGVADVNDTSRVQPNTPFFVPPELIKKQQKLQDQLTDVYKLGLCVIRGLARGRGATQLSNPASPLIPPGLLDQDGIDLLNRAVGADRNQRPSAEEIKDYLIGRVLDLANPPALLSVQLSSSVALRGSEVFVGWTHKGGKQIRIYNNVDNWNKIITGAPPTGTSPIMPPTACEIFVEVSNEHGADSLSAGRLDYYEIPPLHIDINPPALSIPDLPDLRLPETHAKLPPYPMHPAEAVPVPTLRWPHIPPLKLEKVAPHAPMATDLKAAIGHVYKAVDAGVDGAVGDVLRRKAHELRQDAERMAAAGQTNPFTSP